MTTTTRGFKRSPIDGGNIYHDNFQLGHDWFVKSVRLVDAGEQRQAAGGSETVEHVDAPAQRKGQQGDLPFRSMPAHAQTRYAIGLEKESMKGIEATFGPRAQEQWLRAYREWDEFGNHVFDAFNEVMVDGKLVRHKVKLNDNTITQYNQWIKEHPDNKPPYKSPLHPNQQYWADRWADQMNYPYWKDRSLAESEVKGTQARKLFYEGTKAYKSADFPLAVEKFKEGLKLWDELLKGHQPYRNDDLNKKDTGLVVKRYARACQQSQVVLPPETPFLDLLKAYENDNTKDPFDALEMLDNHQPELRSRRPKPRLIGGTDEAIPPDRSGADGDVRPARDSSKPAASPLDLRRRNAYDIPFEEDSPGPESIRTDRVSAP